MQRPIVKTEDQNARNIKRHAPYGQWKTPPQILYSSRPQAPSAQGSMGSTAQFSSMKRVSSTPDLGMQMNPPPLPVASGSVRSSPLVPPSTGSYAPIQPSMQRSMSFGDGMTALGTAHTPRSSGGIVQYAQQQQAAAAANSNGSTGGGVQLPLNHLSQPPPGGGIQSMSPVGLPSPLGLPSPSASPSGFAFPRSAQSRPSGNWPLLAPSPPGAGQTQLFHSPGGTAIFPKSPNTMLHPSMSCGNLSAAGGNASPELVPGQTNFQPRGVTPMMQPALTPSGSQTGLVNMDGMRRSGLSCPDLASLNIDLQGQPGMSAVQNPIMAFPSDTDMSKGGSKGTTKKLDPALIARLGLNISAGPDGQYPAAQMKKIMGHPDLMAIYERLRDEDERRKKRLARNRASARLRRLKKKTLVETYEQEVNQLESAMQKLKNHQWGQGSGDTLLEALGVERQPLLLSRDLRYVLTDTILLQHCERAKNLRGEHGDLSFLIMTLLNCFKGGEELSPNFTLAAPDESDPRHDARAAELDHFMTNLKYALEENGNFVPGFQHHDRSHLGKILHSFAQETRELQIMEKCLNVISSHKWLHFPQTEKSLEAFRSVLSQQQMQKFISWTETNKVSIDMLDTSFTEFHNALKDANSAPKFQNSETETSQSGHPPGQGIEKGVPGNNTLKEEPTFYFGDQDVS